MPERHSRVAVLIGLSLPIFYVFWILFTGTFALHELLIGIVGTLLTTTGLLVVNLQYEARFSPSLLDLITLWRIPWYLLSGTWEIVMVATKDLLGIKPAKSLFRIASFDAGDERDPRATARRVLAVTYTTIAPNFIIVGINRSNGTLLFHQIERSSVPKMTQDLGAME